MKTLKQIFAYLIWIALALLLGLVYMRIVLGSNNIPSEGFGVIWNVFYSLGLLHVGSIIGGIIAVLFILLDIVYLKKKFENNIKTTLIRFLVLIIITVFVGTIHYILEKVIDVI